MKFENLNQEKFEKIEKSKLISIVGGRKRLVRKDVYQVEVDCPDYIEGDAICYENRTLERWENVNVFGQVTGTWVEHDVC